MLTACLLLFFCRISAQPPHLVTHSPALRLASEPAFPHGASTLPWGLAQIIQGLPLFAVCFSDREAGGESSKCQGELDVSGALCLSPGWAVTPQRGHAASPAKLLRLCRVCHVQQLGFHQINK